MALKSAIVSSTDLAGIIVKFHAVKIHAVPRTDETQMMRQFYFLRKGLNGLLLFVGVTGTRSTFQFDDDFAGAIGMRGISERLNT